MSKPRPRRPSAIPGERSAAAHFQYIWSMIARSVPAGAIMPCQEFTLRKFLSWDEARNEAHGLCPARLDALAGEDHVEHLHDLDRAAAAVSRRHQ
jgi:hypothetical protein